MIGNPLFGYSLSFSAALLWGGAMVLVKEGVTDLAPPLVGSAIAIFAGTFILLPLGLTNTRAKFHLSRKVLVFFGIAGLMSAVGTVASFSALKEAPVAVVTPIFSITPLFVLILTHLFLQHLERVTFRTVLGALLMVAGVVIITVFEAL